MYCFSYFQQGIVLSQHTQYVGQPGQQMIVNQPIYPRQQGKW